jgi:hypothetical protein
MEDHRHAEFRNDREAALRRMFTQLPDGPDMSGAERVSDFIGTPDYPSITRRRIVGPGVALIGDAATRRYQWRHRRSLLPNQFFNIDFSRERTFNLA